MNLLDHGVAVPGPPGRETLAVPSISFSAMCDETRRRWDPANGPLPPP